MSIESAMAVTRAGLSYERLRLDAASRNIASANMPITGDVAATSFELQMVNGSPLLREMPASTRTVYEPGNPVADDHGMVHYPATDLVREMTTLVVASRGYEANVRAFNLLRGIAMKALEIGGR